MATRVLTVFDLYLFVQQRWSRRNYSIYPLNKFITPDLQLKSTNGQPSLTLIPFPVLSYDEGRVLHVPYFVCLHPLTHAPLLLLGTYYIIKQ